MSFYFPVTEARPVYGLRSRVTGLVARVETVSGGIYGPKCALTFDKSKPYWKTFDLQGLIMTVLEDRPRYNAMPETPIWNGVDIGECDPVRFFEHCEYGPEGGDPVSVVQSMQTFTLDIVDMRDNVFQTADITKIHYGAMQSLFHRYDMDKIDRMALAIVAVAREVDPYDSLGIVGDIGVTDIRGPCRIVEVAPLPEDWELNDAQNAQRELGMVHRLVLLDKEEIQSWIDYDTIDTVAPASERRP